MGSYTVLAAGHVGADAVAVEPVPSTFDRLRRNVRFNDLDQRVRLVNAGIGASETRLLFTSQRNAVNHVVSASDIGTLTTEVAVTTLDRLCDANVPTVIKIDVEGFEHEVLDGGPRTLSDPSLMAVLMELNGSGARYGADDAVIHARTVQHGFTPYRYEPFANRLQRLEDRNRESANTLYIRDVAWAEQRLRTAAAITLPWRSFPCGN